MLPGTVGVYGGGRMGAGIAHAFLAAGPRSSWSRPTRPPSAAARERVATSLLGAEERGRLEGCGRGADPARRDHRPGGLAGRTGGRSRPGGPRPQGPGAGHGPGRAPDAVLATNTRSLSVDDLAAGLRTPGASSACTSSTRCPPAKLVEIVVGAATYGPASRPPRPGSRALDKTRSRSPTRRASRAAGSASRSPWRRCGCSRRASPRPPTSTPR